MCALHCSMGDAAASHRHQSPATTALRTRRRPRPLSVLLAPSGTNDDRVWRLNRAAGPFSSCDKVVTPYLKLLAIIVLLRFLVKSYLNLLLVKVDALLRAALCCSTQQGGWHLCVARAAVVRRAQGPALVAAARALDGKREEEAAELRRQLEEHRGLAALKDEAMEQEAVEELRGLAALKDEAMEQEAVEELRERAAKEEADHGAELRKHKAAFVELSLAQRQLEVDLARAARLAGTAEAELRATCCVSCTMLAAGAREACHGRQGGGRGDEAVRERSQQQQAAFEDRRPPLLRQDSGGQDPSAAFDQMKDAEKKRQTALALAFTFNGRKNVTDPFLGELAY